MIRRYLKAAGLVAIPFWIGLPFVLPGRLVTAWILVTFAGLVHVVALELGDDS